MNTTQRVLRRFKPAAAAPHAANPSPSAALRLHILRPPSKTRHVSSANVQTKRKPRGSYTRVLLAFGVGVPLGFAIHTLYRKNNNGTRSSPGGFAPYTLVDKQPISSTSSIFSLFPTSNSIIDTSDPSLNRAITSVQIKQPQLQIARWYTILPRTPDQEPHELRFLIRKEQNGEVSGYLHRLPVDAEMELRGPNVDFLVPENVGQVVFLAGGTGIAPAMRVASVLAGQADMHLLWANRRREDCIRGRSDSVSEKENRSWRVSRIWSSSKQEDAVTQEALENTGPIVAQLENLKSAFEGAAGQLLIDYFVDEEGTFIRPERVSKVIAKAGFGIDEKKSNIIFVSGPEGFVNYWAGPKRWSNGIETQGSVGGVLASMNLDGWQVVKL